MKYLVVLLAYLPSILLCIIAGVLCFKDSFNWGWFLVAAIILYPYKLKFEYEE